MAASLPSDASDLESESSSQIAESGDQSDISVSSVTQKISRTWTSQKMMKKMAKSEGVVIELP